MDGKIPFILTRELRILANKVRAEMKSLVKTIRAIYGAKIKNLRFKDSCSLARYFCIRFTYNGDEYLIAFVLPSLRIIVWKNEDMVFKSSKMVTSDNRIDPSKAKLAVREVFRYLEENVFI